MSDEGDIHKYEAKLWQTGEIWKAQVLRNGMMWSTEREFGTRDEALAWAQSEADDDRAEVRAQRQGERVTL